MLIFTLLFAKCMHPYTYSAEKIVCVPRFLSWTYFILNFMQWIARNIHPYPLNSTNYNLYWSVKGIKDMVMLHYDLDSENQDFISVIMEKRGWSFINDQCFWWKIPLHFRINVVLEFNFNVSTNVLSQYYFRIEN